MEDQPVHLSVPPAVTRIRPALVAVGTLVVLLGMGGVAIYLANHQPSSPVAKAPAEAAFTPPDPNLPPAILRTPVPQGESVSPERAATLAYLDQLGANQGSLGAGAGLGPTSFSFSSSPPAPEEAIPGEPALPLAGAPGRWPPTTVRETPLSRALRAPLDPSDRGAGDPGERPSSLADLFGSRPAEPAEATPPSRPPSFLFDPQIVRLGLAGGAGEAPGKRAAGVDPRPVPGEPAESPTALGLEASPFRLEGSAPGEPALAPGTLLPAALLTAVDSTVAGPVVAQLTHDVFDSATLSVRLLPRGTRLLGRYDAASFGQGRLLVLWELLGLPDGRLLKLPPLPGAAADGSAGLRGRVDNHLARTVGSALLLSLISAGSQLSQPDRGGSVLLQPTSRQVVAGAVGEELAQVSAELLRRVGNLSPTFRIPSGTAFNVVLTQPLLFPRTH
jgi:type IV secretory pathway VirB10-like protein